MTKEEAIAIWGEEAVELGSSYYETDFDKCLFAEHIKFPDDQYEGPPWDQFERCSRAFRDLHGVSAPLETFVDQWWEDPARG